MMYDDNFLYSFCDRVKKNYEAMKNSEYNVTMLLCSFAGILSVIDDRNRQEWFSTTNIPNYIKININTKDDKYKETEILAFYRHLRNSLCHLKIDEKRIMPDEEDKISCITLNDYKFDKSGKKAPENNFECTLTVKELEKLFYEVVVIIQEKTAEKED